MRLYALVEAGDPEAIDVYLCEQDAQRALEVMAFVLASHAEVGSDDRDLAPTVDAWGRADMNRTHTDLLPARSEHHCAVLGTF
jgi:hypothetical protein